MNNKEPGPDVFTPPAELAGGDPSVAEAALAAAQLPPVVVVTAPGDAGGESPAPSKSKAKDRRGLASPKHSKKQLRDNVKQLMDEKEELTARLAAAAPAGVLEATALEQAEVEASAGVKFFATEIFELLVRVRGQHWKQSEEKLTRIGAAWGKPLAPHWGKGNPWVMAALSTAVIIAPSIYTEAELAAKKKGAA